MDSEVILHLIAKSKEPSLESMIVDAVRQLRGAFSVLMLTKNALIAVRDPQSFRPLCLGRLGDATIITSESCALDIIGAEGVRKAAAGQVYFRVHLLLASGQHGVRGKRRQDSSEAGRCARPEPPCRCRYLHCRTGLE